MYRQLLRIIGTALQHGGISEDTVHDEGSDDVNGDVYGLYIEIREELPALPFLLRRARCTPKTDRSGRDGNIEDEAATSTTRKTAHESGKGSTLHHKSVLSPLSEPERLRRSEGSRLAKSIGQ